LQKRAPAGCDRPLCNSVLATKAPLRGNSLAVRSRGRSSKTLNRRALGASSSLMRFSTFHLIGPYSFRNEGLILGRDIDLRFLTIWLQEACAELRRKVRSASSHSRTGWSRSRFAWSRSRCTWIRSRRSWSYSRQAGVLPDPHGVTPDSHGVVPFLRRVFPRRSGVAPEWSSSRRRAASPTSAFSQALGSPTQAAEQPTWVDSKEAETGWQ